MSERINIGVYRPILAVRDAWVFDLGATLMRIYTFMVTIGSLTLFTLLGHSVLLSGSVSSCIALATFLISPRVSKLIDERGQSKVVPGATIVAMAGLVLMLCVASFSLPFWINYLAAVAMGFVPNASAIARTRWTYLVRAQGDRLGLGGVDLKTVFSYEGIIDDVSFMIGPSTAVALSSCLFPAAGLGFGGLCYAVGVVLLMASKSTEPLPGWADGEGEGEGEGEGDSENVGASNYGAVGADCVAEDAAAGTDDCGAANCGDVCVGCVVEDAAAGADACSVVAGLAESAESDELVEPTQRSRFAATSTRLDDEQPTKKRSLIVENSQIRVLFFQMFGIGSLYGVLDTATVTFGQDMGVPVVSSVALVAQALFSIVVGICFGAMQLKCTLFRQWVRVCCLIGCSYLLLLTVRDIPTFFLAICIGACFYAPFLITLNTACERTVDNSRLTEAITQITAGMTFGLAVGPTIAGAFVDQFGSVAGFNAAAFFAAWILAVTLLCIPVMRKPLQ